MNREATSQMRGIVPFRNSESAIRRWSITSAQRTMAVMELKYLTGIDNEETAEKQCQKSRIKKDNSQMKLLNEKMDEFCNPFANEVSSSLVNVVTGRDASKSTESYLVNTLKRGEESREQFLQEWEKDSRRFLKLVR